MSAQQQIVAVGGVSLVAINLVRDKSTRDELLHGLSGAHAGGGGANYDDYRKTGRALGKIALQLLFVGGLTFAAGLSRAWGAAMAAVVIGLAILYAVNSPAGPAQRQARHDTAAGHDPQQRTR